LLLANLYFCLRGSGLTPYSSCTCRAHQEYRELLVIKELYRQQEEMHRTKTHRIDHRIVSISQPYVRPIVRGKAKANVEFGSKVAVKCCRWFCHG
jgi:hypothetical protein